MIEIKDLQKVIDGQTVIDIPSISVNPGQIAGFYGPVGSKLGVIFELLTGQEHPTAGTVSISKVDPFHDREVFSRQVGVLFAEDNLYSRQSVHANLDFYRRLYQLPPERVEEVLMVVGLADQANTRVEKLNPSLVRRLAYGRAILHQPAVLLLNEPFRECDLNCVSLISKQIQQQGQDGTTILILTHDNEQIHELCEVVYRFDQGSVVDIYQPGDEERESLPFKIPARLEHTVALVDPADIYFAYAQDDRTFLQTEDGSLPTQFTMTELEQRLARSGFFRAHRSYLVNLQLVKEVIPYTRDSFSLRLKDPEGTKIPLSKSAAKELRDILGY
ncbi:MAG: LytTR family transcriptional regulator DNA-binding domain-containing protein [Anaerolineales bacterium]